MTKRNDHTFAICAYKESPYLEECILSLKNQTVKSNIIMATSTPNEWIQGLAEKYEIPLYINTGEGGIAQDWNFALHTLCGFRQLRRGAAGDRVPHKPLRASYAGGLAGGKAPCPTLYASGLDIWIRLFSEMPHQAKAQSISPRAFRFIRSRNPHCRRPRR